jgi:hypothetical protein
MRELTKPLHTTRESSYEQTMPCFYSLYHGAVTAKNKYTAPSKQSQPEIIALHRLMHVEQANGTNTDRVMTSWILIAPD